MFDRLQYELQSNVDKPSEKEGTELKDGIKIEPDIKPPEKKKPARRVTTRSAKKKEEQRKLEPEIDDNKENTPKNAQRSSSTNQTPTIITEIFQGKLLSEVCFSPDNGFT